MNQKTRTALLAMLVLLGLTACGGGGGGSAAPPPAGNSNWDSLIWDQDNWV